MTDDLFEAYRSARYHVPATRPFVLRIDEPSPALDDLLAAAGVTDAAYVTAHNPGPASRSRAENDRAQSELEAELRARHLRFLSAYSDDAHGGHHEEGVLVLGLDAESARALGRRFGQAAVVSCRAGGRPQLLPCDD